MVKPMDFIQKTFPDPIDRAILYELYLFRRASGHSAREITASLAGELIGWGIKCQSNTENKTIRNHLAKLVADGVVTKTIRPATGEPGRSPNVYQLSNEFKAKIDCFLYIKDIPTGLSADIILEGV